MSTTTKRSGIGVLVGAIALALLFIVPLAMSSDSNAEPVNNAASSDPATPSDTEKNDFVIDMPKRDGNRLNADGVPTETQGDAEAFRDFIAAQAERDPLTLYSYYMASPLGETKPLENEAVLAKDGRLENGNEYSKLGKEAYEEWLAIWDSPMSANITAKDEITFGGVNTGVNGTTVVQDEGGAGTSEISGYDISYKNALNQTVKEHSALNRCTQVTYGTPQVHLPPGGGDTPEDEKKNPALDPYPQGNAPVGGGPNADPTAGDYVAPQDMDRPGTQPRSNPAPAAPTPGGGSGGGSAPKPDPTFTPPAPEPSAPTPADPVRPDEGSGCAPGLSC